ncbi:MAG: hypothetical protein KKF62_02910 [Bacteroidetes bacterium]|nr:hypothetical protein [Bacteroidota bacterium]MBU1114964.1 hypothetical protein [Bacteroidota bacterium]MBU1797864.1 hypothetical protein [Bacteroidota bacterium]
MKYTKAIFFILSFTMALVFFSCEKGTEPEQLKPGRRDYVWTEDTLDVARSDYMTFRDVVGNSPDDIWLGTLDATSNTEFWHYNGVEWKSLPFPGIIPTALLLFEDNTLWAGTGQDYIWKRENGQWTESFKIELKGYDKVAIYSMAGQTKDNIYAVGWATSYSEDTYKGIILHYDGANWNFVDIPYLTSGFVEIVYQKNINTYFIYSVSTENSIITYQIFEFDGVLLKEIISPYGSLILSKVGDIAYFSLNQKVYKYINKEMKLWKDFTGTSFKTVIFGRSESDFFNHSYEGIGHYNGLNYETIYKTHLELYGMTIFEKDIFICSEDYKNHKYIIIHGKLKE